MTIANIPPGQAALIQENALQRIILEAMNPKQMYRADCDADRWVVDGAPMSQNQTFTRAGLIDVDTRPLVPGVDPSVGKYDIEQWRVIASQQGKSVITHMPTSVVGIDNKFVVDARQLGVHAGMTLNRLVRNRLISAYIGGEAYATATVASGLRDIHVTAINGFSELTASTGALVPVSPANPIAVTFSGAEVANSVVAAIPDSADNPIGPGTLTLSAALTTGVTARDVIYAGNRTPIVRVDGSNSIDGLASTEIMTTSAVLTAVSHLRDRNVPTHMDGTYHVHLSARAERQLLQDTLFRDLYRGGGASTGVYGEAEILKAFGCTFVRNTESPKEGNVTGAVNTGTSAVIAPEIGGQVVNNGGVPVDHTIVTGSGTIVEKYIDESKYTTIGGVNGVVSQNWRVTAGGVEINLDRIRYIIRAPIDALQQVYTQSWSWSGDFGIPSDQLAPGPERYKRAVAIQHSGV